ncbi:MAG: hypothetical protein Kow0031_26280 [Anaerolineae bacterium]
MENLREMSLALAAASVLLGAALAGWQARPGRADDSPALSHLLSLLYFVGMPYLAVVLGLLPPRLLGLTGAEYVALINWDRPLFIQLQQTFTLTILEWLFYLPATLAAGSLSLLLFGFVWWQLKGIAPPGQRQTLLETLYLALHWAFYRAIFWRISDDLYLAALWGAALVLLELALMSLAQRQPALRGWTVEQALLLTLTTLVFFFSPNLWLLLPIHWLMVAALNSTNRPVAAVTAVS